MEASLPDWPCSPVGHKWELKKLVIMWKIMNCGQTKGAAAALRRQSHNRVDYAVGIPWGPKEGALGQTTWIRRDNACKKGHESKMELCSWYWSIFREFLPGPHQSHLIPYAEGGNLANIHEKVEKKIFLAIFHQLFPKDSNDGVNKDAAVTSRYIIIILSVGFRHNSVYLWTNNASIWY